MQDIVIVLLCVFLIVLGIVWAALYYGGKWFTKKQTQSAGSASADLAGMFIFTDASRLLAINVVVLIFLPVAAWFVTGNLVAVGACVVLAFIAPKRIVRWIAQKRLGQFEQQLPDALLMICGALRAGASLPIALDCVANEARPPVSQEFGLLLREMRLGVDFSVALANLEKRVPLQDLAMVTAGMALSREVGANLAETLDSIAKTIRSKLQMEGKIRSLTAQGKMQGVIMASLPFLLMFILKYMEPDAMEPLFSTWYGWITLSVVILADLIGYLFIRKITNIDV